MGGEATTVTARSLMVGSATRERNKEDVHNSGNSSNLDLR